MDGLVDEVGEGDHGQGKCGENFVTPCGKQTRGSVFNKEQHHAGERDDAENQRNQPARAVRSNLHSPLFPAA